MLLTIALTIGLGADAELQELQQRRQSVEENEALSDEEREKALALIDQQIRDLLEGGGGAVGIAGAGM